MQNAKTNIANVERELKLSMKNYKMILSCAVGRLPLERLNQIVQVPTSYHLTILKKGRKQRQRRSYKLHQFWLTFYHNYACFCQFCSR